MFGLAVDDIDFLHRVVHVRRQVRIVSARLVLAPLLHNGVDIRALAEYLGHTDPGFTLRVYAHLMLTASDHMRKAVDGMLSGEADGPATDQASTR